MPPSQKTIERNAKILAKYLTGQYTMQQIADEMSMPLSSVSNVMISARKRLMPDMGNIKSNVAKKMEDRITEAMEREIDLGEKMIKKATDNIDTVTVDSATELSTLAKAGVDISRKGYGIKEQDDHVTAIQINLSVPLQLGNDIIGDIITIKDVSIDTEQSTNICEEVDNKK